MKKIKKNDTLRVFLGFAVAAMVIASAIVWLRQSIINGAFFSDPMFPLVTIILALSAGYIIWKKKSSVDSGMPMEDEMSRKVMLKAGYYSYLVSIYTALGVSIFEDQIARAVGLSALEVSDVVGIVILVPAIVFFICIFYFQWKGDA